MGAHHDGTGVQSAYGLEEKVSETNTRKGRPREKGSRPLGVEEAGSLMEECLLAPHCGMRHRPAACDKFKDLSLQHRQSVIAEKKLCARCVHAVFCPANRWGSMMVAEVGKIPEVICIA